MPLFRLLSRDRLVEAVDGAPAPQRVVVGNFSKEGLVPRPARAHEAAEALELGAVQELGRGPGGQRGRLRVQAVGDSGGPK